MIDPLAACAPHIRSDADEKFIITHKANGDPTIETIKFNPIGTTNFIYTPTPLERATLTASIKEWTPNELLYAVGAGLLKNVTDTQPLVKDPDVGSPTSPASGRRGSTDGPVNGWRCCTHPSGVVHCSQRRCAKFSAKASRPPWD